MEDNTGVKSEDPSSGSSPKRDDNILKRGTRVEITGNVRTKQELVGKAGTVKAFNGLGGWHEIELDELDAQGKGKVLSLQRNALRVVGFDSTYVSKDDTVLPRKSKPPIEEEPHPLVRPRMRRRNPDSSDEGPPAKRSMPSFSPPRKNRMQHQVPRAGLTRYLPGTHYPVEQDNAAQDVTLGVFKRKLSPQAMQRYVAHYKVPMSQGDTDLYEAMARHWKSLEAPDPMSLLNQLQNRLQRGRDGVQGYALFGKVCQ